MAEQLIFPTREDFRHWLQENCTSSKGVWLVFGKPGGPKTLRAEEALEEALCFGWIDGQLQRVDEETYLKYFATRTKRSKWSAKNRETADRLIEQGRMARQGYEKIEEAKRNGRWESETPVRISETEVVLLLDKLKGCEPAYSNLLSMSPSVKRSYAGLYLDAKSEEARQRRLEKIIGRLNQNLKPM